jgi:hypothetical protein
MAIIKINNNAIDLDAAEIPNLDASKITTGSLGTDRIPNLDASKITTGTITPSDGTVTTDKIVDANVTLAKLSATGTKDATTFLRGDNTFAEVPVSGGLTMADQWRITADFSSQSAIITSNFEQIDGTGQGTLGSAMTQSSGIFTFPSTGIYLVKFNHNYYYNGFNQYNQARIDVTTNNSSYSTAAEGNQATANESNNFFVSTMVETLVDVTDTANVKVRFQISSQNTITTRGRTSDNLTNFTFIRLGDT